MCIFPSIFCVQNFYNTQSLYFYFETSAIKRKYPTLIVLNLLFQLAKHSISRYINFIFMSLQAKCSEVSTAWNIPCSSEGEGRTFVSHLKVGVRSFFFIKTQGRANTFLKKNYQNSPSCIRQM